MVQLKYLKLQYKMTIIVSIHQPNQELLDMFDNIYVLAKGGDNVYSGHPKDLREYVIECGLKCDDQVPIEALLEYCHGHNKGAQSFVKNVQSQSELVDKINEEGLLEHLTIRSFYKRFSLLDLWNLLKRATRQTYLSQWHILLLQTFIYIACGVVMKFHFRSDMIEPDGCLDIGFRDFTNNCNQTLEDLNNQYLIKLNLKYIHLVTITLSSFMIVFVIVPFLDEIKVIENEYNNCMLFNSTRLFKLIKIFITLHIQTGTVRAHICGPRLSSISHLFL